MRHSQNHFGVELMAQSPAARCAFDDGVRIDEHAVKVEEER